MANAKLEMDDSDSEYDPSKIPANHLPKGAPTISTMTSKEIIAAAEKDWKTIDNVWDRPMFAQMEDVEKALNLIGKWIDGADTRYGTETMALVRRKVIGTTAETKRAELRRMLELRKQVNPEKTTEIQQQSSLTRPTLPPIEAMHRPRSPPTASRPMSNGTNAVQNEAQSNGVAMNGTYHHHKTQSNGSLQGVPYMNGTPQNGQTNGMYPSGSQVNGHPNGTYINGTQPNGIHTTGVLPRPTPYQSVPERQPESRVSASPLAQHPSTQVAALPPIQAERPQPAYHQAQRPEQSAQPATYPITRGKNWIYSQETDLWCPICRKGPLNCMHNHRLIGRIMERGIKYFALEELQFMLESLEEWAYRGKPLTMEPTLTKLYSLEELAAEQKGWAAELRVFLNQYARRGRETTQPVRPPHQHQPTYTHQQQQQPAQAPVISMRAATYQDTNAQRHVQNQAAQNGYDAYGRSASRSQAYAPTHQIRSPAIAYHTSSRGLQPAAPCSMCPRNHPCNHQRANGQQVLTPHQSPEQHYIMDHKRKRLDNNPASRRIRMEFRSKATADRSSSEDDDDNVGGHTPTYPDQAYQKFNQVRAMVDAVPKDQLSASILRMCYSNSMVLNWLKKELKKSDFPKEIAVTGEGSLITPTSPASSAAAKSTASPIMTRPEDKNVKCTKCCTTYNIAGESRVGECHWHDGDLIRKDQPATQSNRPWQDEKKAWTCCGAEQPSRGCRTGKHTTAISVKTSPTMVDRTAVSSLMNIAAGRPAYRQDTHSYSGEHNDEFHGQSLVRALVAAEKESERAMLKRSPISRRASIITVGENDFQAFQDFSPSLDTLRDVPETAFDLGGQFQDKVDLSADQDRQHLHVLEINLASHLQISCARYLTEKRRLFQAVVESMQDGAEFNAITAEHVCKLEPSKACALFSVYERVGWLEPKHFMRYLNDPSGTMMTSVENGRTLPGIHDLPHSGTDGAGRPNSAPDALAQAQFMSRRASSGSASAPLIYTQHIDDRQRKQRIPMHLPHASALFQPLPAPGHLHARHYMIHGHMDHNTVNLTDLPHTPPRDIIVAGSPETYQWRKNGHGKKMQVPICPYPRSWAEADSVDRELVRLKRHEGKQWEELFEWWRQKGRASLKNASCLAVRYSILKKNYEADWVREGL